MRNDQRPYSFPKSQPNTTMDKIFVDRSVVYRRWLSGILAEAQVHSRTKAKGSLAFLTSRFPKEANKVDIISQIIPNRDWTRIMRARLCGNIGLGRRRRG